MIPNNLMRFHENNTIITSLKEFTGSYLSIPNTINAPIERLEISGVSSQVATVQGKNLFNKAKIISSGALIQNIDSRPNVLNLNNARVEDSLAIYNFITPVNIKISFCNKIAAGSGSTVRIRYYFLNGTTQDDTIVATNIWAYRTGTYLGNVVKVIFGRISDGNYAYVDLDTLQIELGSTATAYAPFVPDSPSPYYPSVITNVVNPTLTITDTHTTHITNLFGTLRSLPNGACDKIIIDKSTLTAWIERNVGTVTLSSGTSWNIANAKSNSSYRSSNLASGTLTGTTLTSAVAVPTSFEVDYGLSTPTMESITYPSLETIQYLTNISTNSALNPSIKAKVRVLGN